MNNRIYNHYDKKTKQNFYRREIEGKAVYARKYNHGKWSPYFDSPKEVIEWIKENKDRSKELKKKLENRQMLTFKECYFMWYEALQQEYILDDRSPATLARHVGNMNNYIFDKDLPYKTLADEYMLKLTEQDVIDLKNDINKYMSNGRSRSTIGNVFNTINQVCRWAKNNKQLQDFSLQEISVQAKGKKQPARNAVRNFFSFKEYNEFMDVVDEKGYDYFMKTLRRNTNGHITDAHEFVASFRKQIFKSFMSFIFFTGARKNEARGIKWCDIIEPLEDFPLHRIYMETQYNEKYAKFTNKEVVTRKPKTDQSVREVTLHDICTDELFKLKALLQKKGLYNENDYVFKDFFTTNAKPVPQSNLDRWYDYFLTESKIESRSKPINGIERNITFHGMRHSACTYYLELGMDKRDVAAFLGHADLTMVEYVYSHFINPIDMDAEKRKRTLGFFQKKDGRDQ